MGANVSVVIPVYGVERYIERCARSLFEQTLDDIEYLFIDDCTPDNSMIVLRKVLEDYPKRKAQVVIHKMEYNSGQAAVRRHGIQLATGDYIIHCDSDDWVDHDMYRLLYEKAVETDSDIVICDYYTTDGENKTVKKGCLDLERDALIRNFCSMRISWSACNKLVKTSLLHAEDINYPDGAMGEDMTLILQLILKTNSIAYVPQPLYYYYFNSQSITHTNDTEKIYKRFSQLEDNSRIVLAAFEKVGLLKLYNKELTFLKWTVRRSLWEITYLRRYRKIWRATYPELFPILLFNPYLKTKEKLQFLLTYVGLYPRTYSKESL